MLREVMMGETTRYDGAGRLILGAAIVAVVSLAGTASAEEPKQLQIGIGLKGGVTGTGATEVPEDATYEGPNGRTFQTDPQLFGAFGVGGALGPNLDIRYDRVVGLETGVYFTNDSTEGTNDIEDQSGRKVAEITQSQSVTATHVPLMLKLSPPFDDVRPVLGLGVEWVIQSSGELSYEGENVAQNEIDELNRRNVTDPVAYTLFQATAGVEIDAGPVRIPIELRVGYNLGWNDSFDRRVAVQNAGQSDERFDYDGKYLGHFGLYTGVLYRWDIDL